jgi:hypothetical protein
MRKAALVVALLLVPSIAGCSALSQWFSEMASWRSGAGHTREEMVNEYNSEVQSVAEMNGTF